MIRNSFFTIFTPLTMFCSLRRADPSLLSPEARAVISDPGGHNEGFPDTFKQLYAEFHSYILAGDFSKTHDFPTFEDEHYEMQLCEAIERSARDQAWVKIN